MISNRLGSTADSRWSRPDKTSQGRLLGRYFAAKREGLRKIAHGMGVHHLANLGGAPRLVHGQPRTKDRKFGFRSRIRPTGGI